MREKKVKINRKFRIRNRNSFMIKRKNMKLNKEEKTIKKMKKNKKLIKKNFFNNCYKRYKNGNK